MNILFHHIQTGMTKDLLQSVDVAAVFKIACRKRMPEQMCPDAGSQ